MRVSTAFNKMLGLAGVSVAGVGFCPEGVVLGLRRRRCRLVCPCGFSTWAVYDRRRRRWRHLDLGGCRLWLEAEVRRLECRRCRRVRTEVVPWARPGARHSRDFEDVVAWLAQRMDKTAVCRLLRVSWEAVARIVTLVVAEHLDDSRLEGLYRIGVDEVSYRKGFRYLTVVADHDRGGAVVWAGEGKTQKVLEQFYGLLGPERVARLEAVSMDMGVAYQAATSRMAPGARQCVDPFHVIQLANRAVDRCRLDAYWELRKGPYKGARPPHRRVPGYPFLRSSAIKNTRWALIKDPGDLTAAQRAQIEKLRRSRSVLYRAWQLKEALRDLYRLEDPALAAGHLKWWLAWASRSRIGPFVKLARTIRDNQDRVLAAVELGLSNSKLEGLNSKISLINHRGYGHHSAAAVIAMVYLCAGPVSIELPLH